MKIIMDQASFSFTSETSLTFSCLRFSAFSTSCFRPSGESMHLYRSGRNISLLFLLMSILGVIPNARHELRERGEFMIGSFSLDSLNERILNKDSPPSTLLIAYF